MMQVKSIDIHEVKKQLKTCPKDVQDYVRALESAVERHNHQMQKAIKKIKELSTNTPLD